MATMKTRSRMISVRLSEEEYLSLLNLCSATGARSLSDLTRDAMRMLLRGANRDDFLRIYVEEFRMEMKTLDRKIEQLAVDFMTFKSDAKPD